jgi:hypothetical protein
MEESVIGSMKPGDETEVRRAVGGEPVFKVEWRGKESGDLEWSFVLAAERG